MLKKFFRQVMASILGWQVRRLYKRNAFKTVVVVGSVGKSSTKRAIAQYLGGKFSVQYQDGNYNDLLSVPLVYFGLQLPSLFNPFSWLKTLLLIEYRLTKSYPYDIVVLELGTDAPGQIGQFSSYVRADVAVVTAVSPEHMEFFGSLDEVAKEELSVSAFCNQLIVNIDDIPKKYLHGIKYQSYGVSGEALVQLKENHVRPAIRHEKKEFAVQTKLIGAHVQKILCAAYLTGLALSLEMEPIEKNLRNVTAMPGRMQLLEGRHDITIIDDTYNASPEAVVAALDTLYEMKASQKMAVLGNMNEMGGYSKAAHEHAAKHCDPSQLDEVVVIGHEAELFLAPAANQQGNRVKVFKSPYEIGEYLSKAIKPNGVVLLKGSQNGVFLEEAIKPLLVHSSDEEKLVRQSPAWLKKKAQLFKKH